MWTLFCLVSFAWDHVFEVHFFCCMDQRVGSLLLMSSIPSHGCTAVYLFHLWMDIWVISSF